MNEAFIKVSEDHIETCVMYTALIANPATGKSQSLGLFQKAISEIEKHTKVDEENSKLVKGVLALS
jgi:hypothetical protein